MAPLCVAVFSDSYRPYVSGVVRSIELVRQELQRRGHRVAVFAPAYPACGARAQGGCGGGPSAGPEAVGPGGPGGRASGAPLPAMRLRGRLRWPPWPEGADVYRFPSLPAPRYPQFRVPVPWAPGLRSVLAALGPHVVHLHSPFVLGRVGLSAARRLRVPVVLTVHTQYDVYLEQYAGLMAVVLKPGLLRLLRRVADACDAVVAPTASVRRRLERLGVAARIEVLPSGVPVQHFRAGDRQVMRRRWGIAPDRRVLLYVGRLSAEKNLGLLLDALRHLGDACPEACLVLVGEGPLRPALARQAEGPLSGRLLVPGPLDYASLPDALAAADVFVFPSQSETQGLAVVEAMAAGLPVVAVRSPEIVEVAGDAALVVDPSPAALAHGVRAVLEDPARAGELALRARRRAQDFDLPRAVQRLEELYAELCRRERGAGMAPGGTA